MLERKSIARRTENSFLCRLIADIEIISSHRGINNDPFPHAFNIHLELSFLSLFFLFFNSKMYRAVVTNYNQARLENVNIYSKISGANHRATIDQHLSSRGVDEKDFRNQSKRLIFVISPFHLQSTKFKPSFLRSFHVYLSTYVYPLTLHNFLFPRSRDSISIPYI